MSLTYQPFATVSEVNRLGDELHRNVPDIERLASGIAGIGLTTLSQRFGGVIKWGMVLAGGALIRRALSGRCPLYEGIGIDRRHR